MSHGKRKNRISLAAAICAAAVIFLPPNANLLGQEELLRTYHQAVQLFEQGKPKLAIPIMEKAVVEIAKHFGDDSPQFSGALKDLAEFYLKVGDFKSALTCYLKKNELDMAVLAFEHELIGGNYLRIGTCYQNAGELDLAEKSLLLSMKSMESGGRTKTIYYVRAQTILGTNYCEKGEFGQSRLVLEKALLSAIDQFGEEHQSVADIYNNIGLLLRKQEDFAQAIGYYNRALKCYEAIFENPESESEYGGTLTNLGRAYLGVQEIEKSLNCYSKALRILEDSLGESHPNVSHLLNLYSEVLYKSKQLQKAEILLKRCIAIRVRNFGKDSVSVALARHDLALNQMGRNDLRAAEENFSYSIPRIRQRLGQGHYKNSVYLESFAQLRILQQDNSRAAELLGQSQKLAVNHAKNVMPKLTENDQFNFFVFLARRFSRALSVALLDHSDQSVVSRTAEWNLNSKGIVQESMGRQQKALKQMQLNGGADSIGRLLDLRRQISEASAGQAPGASSKSIAEMIAEEQALIRELAKNTSSTTPNWFDISQVRKNIKPKSVLVEFAKIDPFKFKKEQQFELRPRYVAWVIPALGEGSIRFVDLGEADRIDQLVSDSLQQIAGMKDAKAKDRISQARKSKEKLRRLAVAIYQPLNLRQLPDELIISPDSNLWLVPWAALTMKDNTYLIEKTTIRCVNSGRFLVANEKSESINTAPLVIADPDFEMGANDVSRLARKVLDRRPFNPQRGSYGGVAQRLPATKVEANKILTYIEKISNMQPRLFTDRDAIESRLKMAKSPYLIVLSTHGFFDVDSMPPVDVAQDQLASNKSPIGKAPQKLSDPLSRCGLLFAGSNTSDGDDLDDGVLTGNEIANCDLSGTKLVVLSACDSGVGQVCNGVGVSGLRLAFQLAGAEKVVASLWKVDDDETARTMISMFQGMSNGKSTAEALRDAQVKRIERHRSIYGIAHPYFWAPFTVTGN